jgi:hypothetical protein
VILATVLPGAKDPVPVLVQVNPLALEVLGEIEIPEVSEQMVLSSPKFTVGPGTNRKRILSTTEGHAPELGDVSLNRT